MFNYYLRSLFLAIPIALLLLNTAHAETEKEEMWPVLKEIYFENKTILTDADDWLILDAPSRAEDAAIVPLTLKSLKPQTAESYIKNIHILIDDNPDPYSANFHLTPTMEQVNLTFRMRFQKYSNVRAIVEMNDGALYMVSRFVKASGGCSAPVQKDPEAVKSRLGKMQIRMRKPEIGHEVPVQVMISHPNYNGLQFDQQTRRYIPAHYVKTMSVNYAEQSLFSVDMGISFSEDPSVHFTFKPNGPGVLKAIIIDSKEATYTSDKTI
ncbi:quinoprotein dehydrogenase-associated SoxYZ-like carrier [Methylophaga sp. OBS4]|uniref:quinoprotein dehydrogenase-associated SoxYZ-like carrier n=1 Tax=Methylophaga sp. OBS4 TaxID=2991935 RepID=UPI00224DBF46|nr:quinoprotein dehydrogenase-associated SoxYZ-like carrier [Methylophaga sp. OBS4]MCX4187730.1 quinoprotein dehydrogenase-associated SoxYZ-like carrier [Methylophaga sp. OBS4]MCX4187751.1 quinoprotein dehydrogenase-associated SoxYZ-like carrier [Methylophaga sp. OBS4]